MSPSSESPAGGGSAGDFSGGQPAGSFSSGGPAGSPPPEGGESAERSVVLPNDLHARPAGKLTRAAAGFTAVTTLVAGERSANARSVLAVMALGATAGSEVSVRAVGADASVAADALATLLLTPDPPPASPA